ncbi:MAG: efflux RND transporter periplasmic adaptor subunit [Pseudomonadota bacterium]
MKTATITLVTLLTLTSFAVAQDTMVARGLVVAKERATLSSNLAAPVAAVHADLGDPVAEGTVLLTFDCSILEASQAQVEAQISGAEANLRAKERLLKLRSSSQLEVDLAKAELDALAAEMKSVLAKLRYCSVRAPFDGRIARRYVDPFETLSQDKPLFDIVGDSLRVHVIAPSTWMRWIAPGEPFDVEIEEIGKRFSASVSVIGARVDHASQLVELYGEFRSPPTGLLPGMSGRVSFPRQAGQ